MMDDGDIPDDDVVRYTQREWDEMRLNTLNSLINTTSRWLNEYKEEKHLRLNLINTTSRWLSEYKEEKKQVEKRLKEDY